MTTQLSSMEFRYANNEEGKLEITEAIVSLSGQDQTGVDYFNARATINKADLPDGANFMGLTYTQILAIVSKKMTGWLTVSDTTTTK